MKILYIYQFLTYGGVEMLLRNRAKYLKKLDPKLEINLLVMKSSVSKTPSEFNNVFVCRSKKEISKKIVEHDLIINVDTPELFDVVERSKKPVILETYTSAKPSRKYLKLKLPSNLRLVVVPSITFKNIVEAEISNKEVPVKVVYNFTDKDQSNNNNLNINFHGSRPILWVGRLEESKGWREALHIFSLLKGVSKNSNIELFLIGEQLDKYDKHIFEIMEDFGVLEYVRYIPRVDFKDMGSIYSLVRKNKGIYLSTSKMETFGLTVLEAMNYGLPCVLNNLEIFKELYQKSASLYKGEDDAVESIKEILGNDGLYTELEDKAKEESKEFNQEKIIPPLYNLYMKVFLDEKNNQ
jgi:glycosyltransferase involved in cell wall biosynthesis